MLITLIQKEMIASYLSARFVALLLMCVLLIRSTCISITIIISNATSTIKSKKTQSRKYSERRKW